MSIKHKDHGKKRVRMPFPFSILGRNSGVSELEELYVDALADDGVCEGRGADHRVEVLSIDGAAVVRPLRGSRVIEVDLA